MIDIHYAYLIGCLIFGLLFWLPIYVWRPNLRREMLLMSLLAAPLGPLTTLFYWHDYWQPLYAFTQFIGFEDLLFSFFIGGFAGVVYEAVFGKTKYGPRPAGKRWWATGMAITGLAVLYVGAWVLEYNSIYVSCVLLVVLAFGLLLYRPQLWPRALFTAPAVAAAMLVMYQFWLFLFPESLLWWNLANLSGHLVGGIPVEELLWGAAWGFFAGPAFEFVAGSRYILNYGTRTITS